MAEQQQQQQQQRDDVTSQSYGNSATSAEYKCEARPLPVNVITRTVSDSAAYAKRDIQKETRTRSVTFYDNYGERQKRKLQRTPTPYWPRKEVDLSDGYEGSSFDDDNPGLDSPSGSISFSPGVSFDEVGQPISASRNKSEPSAVTGTVIRRSLFRKSSPGNAVAVLSIDEESDNEGQLQSKNAQEKHNIRPRRQPAGNANDVGGDTSETDLYRNPLFRRAAASHVDKEQK